MSVVNELGQPVGRDLEAWTPPVGLESIDLVGEHVLLRTMAEGDAPGVLEALSSVPAEDFTYMAFDRPDGLQGTTALVSTLIGEPGWLPYVVEVGEEVRGFASYLRDKPSVGVVEIGSIMFGRGLQRSTAATETIYLMLHHSFGAGYRRVEWKCDSLNERSRKSAVRFGFVYEGTFLNATHYKGRNRDTAWYAMTDDRWMSVRDAFEAWLSSDNFDDRGEQRVSLRQMMFGAGERT